MFTVSQPLIISNLPSMYEVPPNVVLPDRLISPYDVNDEFMLTLPVKAVCAVSERRTVPDVVTVDFPPEENVPSTLSCEPLSVFSAPIVISEAPLSITRFPNTSRVLPYGTVTDEPASTTITVSLGIFMLPLRVMLFFM